MTTTLKPIPLNATSFTVALLHQILAVLGLPAAKEEVAVNTAGPDTLKQVRALQAKLKVPVDESTLVDEATVLAVNEALDKLGLTSASRSFTVMGAVRLQSGPVKKHQQLIAFDLDLRGVKVFRTIQDLAEIPGYGGFEFLGEAESDNQGNYKITFYDWQYIQAERKKADVVVYAVEKEAVTGLSQMVNTDDYSDKGLVRNLDVIITKEDKRTEYEVLMTTLDAFLKENNTSLEEIAVSHDQMSFTAGELDIDLPHLIIAARAELLVKGEEEQLVHELLYGIGRQNIRLAWEVLYKKNDEELSRAIAVAAKNRIIREYNKQEVDTFIRRLLKSAFNHVLDDKDTEDKNTLNDMLSNALPEKSQRIGFLDSLNSFRGRDFREFWEKHLPEHPGFKDKPGLISNLLLTQQLTALTGNHQALVKELQVNKKLVSVRELFDLEDKDWAKIIKKAGVPDFIEGKDEKEKIDRYAAMMQGLLDAAFPTQRIAKMAEKNELGIEKEKIAKHIKTFLKQNEKLEKEKQFNFAGSRIHDFKEQLMAVAGDDYDEVRSELMKIQRVFQVSPDPGTMSVLLKNNLHSAYAIAGIPRKNFIKTWTKMLGSREKAFAVHQLASYVNSRAEMAAMHLMEHIHGLQPGTIMNDREYQKILKILEDHLPNPTPTWAELFGSPDICECSHCRSVYSAAAYFVDLLWFCEKSVTDSGLTLYDILVGKKEGGVTVQGRRPDLAALPLTCENTNTLIPYIDLVNEVMEYYTFHGSLEDYSGHDTGDTTAQELRANPQNSDENAYKILANKVAGKIAVHPFTLPYHQPLDVIRTYSDHLKVSRCEVMKAMNPVPVAATESAIRAECLKISPEEYIIITGEAFDTTADTTPIHVYFGYKEPGGAAKFANMQNEVDAAGRPRGIRPLLERTGLKYTDLVELVKTLFINPHQKIFKRINEIISYAQIDPATVYGMLQELANDPTPTPGNYTDIDAALNEYNRVNDPDITFEVFAEKIAASFNNILQVLTLYEPESKCSLDTTKLRTLQNILVSSDTSQPPWSKIHRFIRLWRKLGWTMDELDLMLYALGEDDITPAAIHKLAAVSLLKTVTRLPVNQLAVFWGNIDTWGDKSLYKKLFLNKAVQMIDPAFKADEWGNYLLDSTEKLADHQSTILAAFRITEEEMDAILNVALIRQVDPGDPAQTILRPLNKAADELKLEYISEIYRRIVLAKALRMRITDLCTLVSIFDPLPFMIETPPGSGQFIRNPDITPDTTYEFYKLAKSIKDSGYTALELEYIIQGIVSPDSRVALKKEKCLQTVQDIKNTFSLIEQEHPEASELQLTSEILAAKLSLIFQPEIAGQFMEILEGRAFFETKTKKNLAITIPDDLKVKYSYTKTTGRLSCEGIMTGEERTALKGLANVTAPFKQAVDRLYAAPADFISNNFSGVFSNTGEAIGILINRTAQTPPENLNEMLVYTYENILPFLKSKLRRDAVIQHIASLIGLNNKATTLLLAGEIEDLVTGLSSKGFTGDYFNGIDWRTRVFEREDSTVDFSWGASAPDRRMIAENFSVRWRAYITAPASGDFTLAVEVEETNEILNFYLDETLILEKPAADTSTTTKECTIALNSAQMHLLTLEYAETTGNAGIRLYWKTATTTSEIIPASVAFPAGKIDDFIEKVIIYHRAARFILGFDISETELNHFLTYGSDFGNIDFKALTADHWKRINSYTILRNAVPQARAFLTDVFIKAKTLPAPTMDDLTELIYLATAWNKTDLQFLVGHFTLGIGDFINEIALNRIRAVMHIVSKTGISAQTITRWGAVETVFNDLHETAQLLKDTVKAKYGDEDWLNIAGNLSNQIRENQKQALISYLLTKQHIVDWGAGDADGLYEYLLIDVQMQACMDTSRIVQANAAVQMFINRCLLNLEIDISPDVIDKDRWEWMKNYRVWEANRKVFLYPENWLEPEWRKDRSEFFKELESYLVQNDITERSVEQGFRHYLTSLNEVANLEVCGMHQEVNTKGEFLHVFARTHNAPYKFFYRRWKKFGISGKWTPWEKVQLDIRCVEDGENSGVHLVPVVWKGRLFLFWPEFMEKQKEPSNSGETIAGMGSDLKSKLEPIKYWEVRLAWSEYVDGKWSPKQLSKEFAAVEPGLTSTGESEKDYLFTLTAKGKELEITITDEHLQPFNLPGVSSIPVYYIQFYRKQFILSDIQSQVRISNFGGKIGIVATPGEYAYEFSNRSANSILKLLNDIYLKQETQHKLLPVNTMWRLDITLDNPFLFSDAYRTYFVRPLDITISERINFPERIKPYTGESMVFMIPSAVYSDYDASPEEISRSSTGGTLKNISEMSKMKYYEKVFSAHTFDFWYWEQRQTKGLEFHTFYHPFSSQFVTNLNQGGLSRGSNSPESPPGLFDSDTEISSDEGGTFIQKYDPNFNQGLVQPSTEETCFQEHTYYKENICFDKYGANSMYNWELFFHAPLYIAIRLSKNGKYKEAMEWFHYIFDPTTDEPETGDNALSRYWKVLPFKTEDTSQRLEDWFIDLNIETSGDGAGDSELSDTVKEWRDNPFDPHKVAGNRIVAYMKHVVIKYVENLIDWGDSLFRQFTRESVYEAIQLYVIARHVLGPRPELVPKRGKIKAKTYKDLKNKLDDFSNALVQLENIFPYSSDVVITGSPTGPNLLGTGETLYFCIPPNDRLLKYWDTVEDRLFKIRHCQDIDGVERRLALFAPPISPEALIQAMSRGLSLGSILADLSTPPPIYRFTYLLQKANELCADVKTLGSTLLSVLEKKDAEELGRMRALHETAMLEQTTAILEREVLDARARKGNLQVLRKTAEFRLQYYTDLLGNETVAVPAEPALSATLTEDSQLPPDTSIGKIETDVDTKLEEIDERGLKLIPKEKEDLDKSFLAMFCQVGASAGEAVAGILNLLPDGESAAEPFGIGAGMTFGGSNWGAATSSFSKVVALTGSIFSYQATQASKMAGFIRREQEWTFQANLAAREIIQLDKQIVSAEIGIQVANKRLDNHRQQIENSKQIELFLQDKFTRQELYQWMKEQLIAVYKQSYNLAFDMAKKAEKAYKYETGMETVQFIQYGGYWDSTYEGLVAGEKLQLTLRQMEKSYLEDNRRELELAKGISLAMLNPLALIELRETGKCYVSLPEELFDLDFQGHYFRRIKSVSLSLPCIAGPYTTVNCSLRLLKNTIRMNTDMGDEDYRHNQEEGLWTDDPRFRSSTVPVTSIATSRGQNDAGMFDFNFRDERYLPFEGAGVISTWLIELGGANFEDGAGNEVLRQFDYSTISDVIIHVSYTARESGGLFKKKALEYIKSFIKNPDDLHDQPLMRMFSMKNEFPSEWHRFLHPAGGTDHQVLSFVIGKERFPFFTQDRNIVVMKVTFFAKCSHEEDYYMVLSYIIDKITGDTITSTEDPPEAMITLTQDPAYGGLHKVSIADGDYGLSLDQMDITLGMSIKMNRNVPDYTSLGPDEVEDIFFVIHYKLSDPQP